MVYRAWQNNEYCTKQFVVLTSFNEHRKHFNVRYKCSIRAVLVTLQISRWYFDPAHSRQLCTDSVIVSCRLWGILEGSKLCRRWTPKNKNRIELSPGIVAASGKDVCLYFHSNQCQRKFPNLPQSTSDFQCAWAPSYWINKFEISLISWEMGYSSDIVSK